MGRTVILDDTTVKERLQTLSTRSARFGIGLVVGQVRQLQLEFKNKTAKIDASVFL